MSTANLSLYNIEAELLDLFRFREDVASDSDMTPAEQAESLKAADQQIELYVRKEVAKADGIAAYLRECQTRSEALKAEAKRIKERADAWAARGERLEAVTLAVMQAIGKKKIEGAYSTLAVRKNPPSVDVRQPELVPSALERVTITIDGKMWIDLLEKDLRLLRIDPKIEPNKTAIKEALKRGDGVPGCELRDDSVRLEVK